ncbi:MAG: DUF1189 family protein [Bacilli bacterium]
MGILKRINSGLSSPKELVNYINDKIYMIIIYILILLIIAVIPTFLSVGFGPALTSTEKISIVKSFNGEPAIPFKVINGRLVHRFGLDDTFEYEVSPTFKVVVSQSTNINVNALKYADYLVLSPDKVYLYVNGLPFKIEILSYSEYPSLANIDFSEATKGENLFWEEIFEIYRLEYNKFRPYNLAINLIESAINSLFMILLFSLLISLFGRPEISEVYGLVKIWKLTIYAMAPYVFLTTIGVLFNLVFFRILGILITVVFVIRMNNYLINIYMNNSKKNML